VRLERVAIVGHSGKAQSRQIQEDLERWLKEKGIEVTDRDPDLVLSLGGDGTMLRAAHVAHAADAPLLGVNMGTLGYLSEVDAGAEKGSLERVIAGDFELEERMMLRCEAEGFDSHVALNETLVERTSRRRLVKLQVWVGGERLATFNADGVIVATPTGSTAYALSAGGPIVSPRAQCLVLVPVSAHMIFARPFVLAPDEIVEIQVDAAGDPAALALDGSVEHDLAPGAKVLVRRHFRPLKLVRLSGPGFVERLRAKLGLPG
jgi:NAD+ kinase